MVWCEDGHLSTAPLCPDQWTWPVKGGVCAPSILWKAGKHCHSRQSSSRAPGGILAASAKTPPGPPSPGEHCSSPAFQPRQWLKPQTGLIIPPCWKEMEEEVIWNADVGMSYGLNISLPHVLAIPPVLEKKGLPLVTRPCFQ